MLYVIEGADIVTMDWSYTFWECKCLAWFQNLSAPGHWVCFLSPSSFDRFVALLGCVDSLNTRVELPWISPILGHNRPITYKSKTKIEVEKFIAHAPGKTSKTHTRSSPPARDPQCGFPHFGKLQGWMQIARRYAAWSETGCPKLSTSLLY